MEKTLSDKKFVALFLGPALLIYTVIFLAPVVWSVGYTFYDGNPITGFDWVGLDNFRDLGSDDNFWRSLRFTAKYAILVTVGQVGAGFGLALLYLFYLRRASALVRTVLFVPFILPTAAIAQLFAKIFEIAPQYGLVNELVEAGGGQPRDWLNSPLYAFLAITIMDIWRSMGFYGILLYAGLVDVPEEVLEAARLDGASGLRLTRYIVIPLMWPILIAAFIFSINSTIKVFDSIYALTGGGPGDSTRPLTLEMYATAFRYGRYGDASAIAMALTVLCLGATLALFRSSRRESAR